MPNSLHSSKIDARGARSFAAPSLFAAFPDDLRGALQAKARKRKFSAGQIIQQSGDEAAGFWVIETGQVKIGRYGEGGRFQVLLLMGPGDSYGELAVFSGSGRVVDAVAVRDSELFWVSDGDLNDAITANPQIARELIRILSSQLQEALNAMIVQRRLTAPKLLARSILALTKNSAAREVLISQDDLAELVGVSRMTISATLRDMEAKGILARRYRKIEILDLPALANY